MNNLEQMKKRKQNLSIIIAILIVLNLLLILVFATNTGNEDAGIATYSGEEVVTSETFEGDINIADVKTGANFTVALDSKGRVWAWGQNDKDQLGDGTLNDSVSKQAVLKSKDVPLNNVKQIDVGEYHAVAVTKNNEVYVWGYNYFGQTGNDSIRKELYAQKVDADGLKGKQIKQIEAGANFTLALTEDGELFGLGDSSNGQLGYYNTLRFTSIRELEEFKTDKELSNIEEISAGNKHIVALKADGTVWTWGDTTGSDFDFTQINEVTFPDLLDNEKIIEIEAGNDVSMALTESGKVYTWNLGGNPQEVTLPTKEVLVEGTEGEETQEVQVQVKEENGIAIINKTYYIIDTDGDVFGWGLNKAGQVGYGKASTSVSTPSASYQLNFNDSSINTKIDKLASSAVPGIGSKGETATNGAYDTAYAINEDGYVLGWGYAGTEGSTNGKLLGDATRYTASYLGGVGIRNITGKGIELNIGDTTNLIQKLEEEGLVTGGKVNLYREETKSIKDAITITIQNEKVATYDKETGELTGIKYGTTFAEIKGDKNTAKINVKVIDPDFKAEPKIQSLQNATIALKPDGTVWAWGHNTYLGIYVASKSTTGLSTPTQIRFLCEGREIGDIIDISLGQDYALLLDSDGKVWAWGKNNYGQLGNGTRTATKVSSIATNAINVTRVTGISNIKSIDAGDTFSMALDEYNNVYVWGNNTCKRLGTTIPAIKGTYSTTALKEDLSILNGEQIKQIKTVGHAGAVVTDSGKLYYWGHMSVKGIDGDSSQNAKPRPATNPSLTNVRKITATEQEFNVVILREDGKIFVCGSQLSAGGKIVSGIDNVVDIIYTSNNLGAVLRFGDSTIGYATGLNAANPTVIKPKAIGEKNDFDNVMLIAGANGSYAYVRDDGTVWTVGNNEKGQLGNRTIGGTTTELSCISFGSVYVDKHEVTIKEGETIDIQAKSSYGFNMLHSNQNEKDVNLEYYSLDGEIATVDGNTITGVKSGKTYVEAEYEDAIVRVTVNVLAKEEVVTPKVSAGYQHTVALKSDGTVWGWGYDLCGAMGKVKTTLPEPQKILNGTYIDIAAGKDFTLVLDESGQVWAMGENNYGQLGNLKTTDSTSLIKVEKQVINSNNKVTYEALNNIVKIEANGNTAFALDKDGKVYIWGQSASKYAREATMHGGLKAVEISGNLILAQDGTVWKYNTSDSNKTILEIINGLSNIVEISSSRNSTGITQGYFMALDGKGNVYTCIGSSTSDKIAKTDAKTPIKLQIATEGNSKIVDIEAGVGFALLKDADGNVYSYGNITTKTAGILGRGATLTVAEGLVPTKIEGLPNIESIATAVNSTTNKRSYAITRSGAVFAFGYSGKYSLLGNGEIKDYYYEPILIGENYIKMMVDGEEKTRVYLDQGTSVDLKLALDMSFKLRVREDDEVDNSDEYEWAIFNKDIVELESDTGSTNTLTAQQLMGEAIVVATHKDTGVNARLYVDVKVESKYGDTKVAAKIESADDHTIAIKSDGTVWAWGNNNYGELGVGGTGIVNEPQQVIMCERIKVTQPTTYKIGNKVQKDSQNRTIYIDSEGNKYLKGTNCYTDLEGRKVIQKYGSSSDWYKWNPETNDYEYADLTNGNGGPIIITDVATAPTHTLLLTTDGDVYSCGYNSSSYQGRLGYAVSSTYGYRSEIPKKIDTLKDIVKIAAGDNYSLALDKYGRLWFFGYSQITVNGKTKTLSSKTPAQITIIAGEDVSTQIRNAIDITNEYILTKDGDVYSINLSLSVPKNSTTNVVAGTKVKFESDESVKIVKITRTSGTKCAGHTAFLTDKGEVFTIGRGTNGQLGNDAYKTINRVNSAVKVKDKSGDALKDIVDIYTGYTHTIAIDKYGAMYTWGSNTYGELKNEDVQIKTSYPRAHLIVEDTRFEKGILVSAGKNFSVIVDETGFIYDWGLGTRGQLGNGLSVNSEDYVRVGIEGIKLDTNHVTLKENGDSIEVSGENKQLNLIYDPELDIESATSANEDVAIVNILNNDESRDNTIEILPEGAGTTSVLVTTADGSNSIIEVTVLPEEAEMSNAVKLPEDKIISPMTVSGDSHTLILKSDGTVWAYGDNTYGQTCAKDSAGNQITYSDKVTQVIFPEGAGPIIYIAAGDNFSVAVDINGGVYTWGYKLAQLASYPAVNNEPKLTTKLSNIVKVVAGQNHCLALTKDGYVYAWGLNSTGYLGIGSTSATTIPKQITNISNAIDIAAGSDHSMILTANGDVYTAGNNYSGQLGVNNISSRKNFARLDIVERMTYIEAGKETSVAIDTDGQLWVWGNNVDGQLGLGVDDTRISIPTICDTLNGVKVQSASAGSNHIQIVTTSGDLYIAGSNNYGQLGVGQTDLKSSRTFILVTDLAQDVMRADAGTTYSTAISKDGTVYGFGDYNHGNPTKVSLTNSFIPVKLSEDTSYLDEYEVVLKIGETYKINASGKYKLNVLHKDSTEFSYESVNNDIASVDEDGIITGISIGTTRIDTTSSNEKCSMIVKVVPSDSIQAPTVDGGDKFTVVTDKKGVMYAFGNNEYITSSNVPKTINDSISSRIVKAGDNFIVAVNYDGTVWTYGDNTYRQLGMEEVSNENQINKINPNHIKDIAQIDAGSKHVIALDKLGRVYVWGDNSNGQLGLETDKVVIPTNVNLIKNRVISVSAGGDYSAIVDAKGTVYIIGNNGVKEVTGISNAMKVAVGTEQTMILTNNGSVYMVNNDAGNPIAMPEITGTNPIIVDIATNQDSFMCLTADKKLYVFGNNENGQLGTNSIILPAEVETDKGIFTMGAGYDNTYYINVDGEVFAAGSNKEGQLGNRTSDIPESLTYQGSSEYTKVGDRTFDIKEVKKNGVETKVTGIRVGINWTIYTGSEVVKELDRDSTTRVTLVDEGKEFNTFLNEINSTGEYEFELDNDDVAELTKNKDYVTIKTAELDEDELPQETKLIVTNKVTKVSQELKIIILNDKDLRIQEMYVKDEKSKIYYAQADTASNYIVNAEGSTNTGTLNLKLEFETDLVKAFVSDKDGNEGDELITEQTDNEWVVKDVDISKTLQYVKLKLTDEDLNEYVYNVEIRKEVILKVDDEILEPDEDGNYTKFINPNNTEAKVYVNILDTDSVIELKDTNNNTLHASNRGDLELEATVGVLSRENEFYLDVNTSKDGKVITKTSKIAILKSSLESIEVKDISNVFGKVKAEKTETTTEGNLDDFYAQVDSANEESNVTLNLKNENVQSVKIITENAEDVVYEVNSKTVTFNPPADVLTIELTVLDVGANTTYTENYKLTIHKISGNNNIEKIILTNVDDDPNLLPEDPEFRKSTEEENVYEIILHNKDYELEEGLSTFEFRAVPENENAQMSLNGNDYKHYSDSESDIAFTMILDKSNIVNDNQCQIPLYVKAENGDIREYKLKIYTTSEKAEIENINVNSPLNDGTQKQLPAQKEEGTNDFVGKVIPGKENYSLEIYVNDSYAEISSIEVGKLDDEVNAVENILTEASVEVVENRKIYTYNATRDIIGRTITIKVQAENPNKDEVEYTLVIEELENEADFEAINVGGNAIEIYKLEEDENGEEIQIELDTFEEKITKEAEDSLVVVAKSKDAKVQIYKEDPRENLDAEPIAEGIKEVNIDTLGLEVGIPRTVYMKITSGDGEQSKVKVLTVIRQSNNANIESVTFNLNGSLQTVPVEDIEDSDEKEVVIEEAYVNENSEVTATPEDVNATVVYGEDDDGNPNEYTTIQNLEDDPTIEVEIISEDETEDIMYNIHVRALSANTEITKQLLDPEDGSVQKDDIQFIPDTTDTSKYFVEIKDFETIDLAIAPKNEGEKQTYKLAIISENGEEISAEDREYIEANKINVNATVVTDVEVIVTAEDGKTTATYIIEVAPETTVVASIDITPYSGNTAKTKQTITPDDILNGLTTVTVDPTSTTANVTLNIPKGKLTTNSYVNFIANEGVKDVDGTNYEKTSSTKVTTQAAFSLNQITLLDNSKEGLEGLDTQVRITFTRATGVEEEITVIIRKGSTEALLDTATVTGANTNDFETTSSYQNKPLKSFKEVIIDSEDTEFYITANTLNNATYKIYEISGENETEILDTTKVILNDSELKRFKIIVTAEFGGEEKTYYLDVRKKNYNTSIEDLTITTNGTDGEQIYNIKEEGIMFDENGNAEIAIPAGITELSITDLILSNPNAKAEWAKNGESYTDAIAEDSKIEYNPTSPIKLNGQTVNIKVITQDKVEKEYRLKFESTDIHHLISINGLNAEGTISAEEKLTLQDFNATLSNIFETNAIAIPSGTEEIVLSNILVEDGVTVKYNEELIDKDSTINVTLDDEEVTQVVIDTESEGLAQQYIINIRKKSNNTAIEKIEVKKQIEPEYYAFTGNAVLDAEENIYLGNIDADKDAQIIIVPEDINGKVINVIAYNPSSMEEFEVNAVENENNTFNIVGLSSLYIDDDQEDINGETNRYIMVEFELQAEDSTTEPQAYKLKSTRQHVETGIETVSYKYDGVEENINVEFNENNVGEIIVDSTVGNLDFNKIIAKCENAKVTIIYDNQPVEQTENGFSIELTEEPEAGDGCIKTLKIKVTAENGYVKTYTINITRMATNASLNKVIVDDKEATRREFTEEDIAYTSEEIAGVFEAGVKDSATQAIIEAISANHTATVSIENDEYTSDNNNEHWDEKGKYNLEGLVKGEKAVILITVTPEDENVPAKTYMLLLHRLYDNTILDKISIKPSEEVEDASIDLCDNIDHTLDFKMQGHLVKCKDNRPDVVTDMIYYYVAEETIEIPTEWNEITIGDILPDNENIEVELSRISGLNPFEDYKDTLLPEMETYTLDEKFVMPEGEDVYIRAIVTSESGDSSVYVMHLYKKSTSTDVKVEVDKKEILPEEETEIYKASIIVEEDSVVISLTGTNYLSKENTKIVSITTNNKEENLILPVDADSEEENSKESLKITKKAKNAKNVEFTISNILKTLDYNEDKVIKVRIELVPEDTNCRKVYEIEITRIHTSTEIEQILGNDVEIKPDEENSHYVWARKDIKDRTIYTKYIDKETSTIDLDITTKSKYADITIYALDETVGEKGLATTTDIKGEIKYQAEIPESKDYVFKRLIVEVDAENKNTKKYEIWFVQKSDDEELTEIDDTSIKALYVRGKLIEANEEDGNYYVDYQQGVERLKVRLVPNYKYANASINLQEFQWQEANEEIKNLENATVDEEGRIRIELKVQIPKEQTINEEEAIENVKYLYIGTVSSKTGIKEIHTENDQDEVKLGGSKCTILLAGDASGRPTIDLTIIPIKNTSKLQLLDETKEVILAGEVDGTLVTESLNLNEEGITTFIVRVTSEDETKTKYYTIEVIPRSSQAELEKLIIGGQEIELEPEVYDYDIRDLDISGIGNVYALATANNKNDSHGKDGCATVKIYAKDTVESTTESTTGEATLESVNLDETKYVTVTVTSPDNSRTLTYVVCLKDVSDDRTLQEITYTDIEGDITKAEEREITEEEKEQGYAGVYEVVVDNAQDSTDISITTSNEKATVSVGEITGTDNTLTFKQDTTNMTEDIVLDVIVTAESDRTSTYKLVIKKPIIITGKIITENKDKNYGGVLVKFVNPENSKEIIDIVETDFYGVYRVELPIGKYNMVIEKPGYLTYIITNIPTTYGVRTYTGNTYLVAGDVYGNDGYIDLRDLTKVNKLARKNTTVNDTNRIYDLNEDGVIDQDELDIMFKNYDKVESSTEYKRMIGIKGEVLDTTSGDAKLADTNITLREKNVTDENAEFEYENVPVGTTEEPKVYDLIVTKADGTLLGESTVTIVEGTEYKVDEETNTITLSPNTIMADIAIRVTGTNAFITKRGETSNNDFTSPIITEISAIVKENEVELTATAQDDNLENIKFYYVDEKGNETELSKSSEVKEDNKTTNKAIYESNELTFNKTYKFKVVATDKYGNKSSELKEVTDNVIREEKDLVEFSKKVNAGKTYEGETVILVSDLDLSEDEFTPIGKDSNKAFKGTFDGSGFDESGHTITLNISKNGNYAGLFGYTKGATIKNVGVEGTISATANFVGGIAGKTENTTVENCYNSATIEGQEYVGGIVGGAEQKTVIIDCYNAGDTTGFNNIGGIIGRLDTIDATVEYCYNVGTITATDTEAKAVGQIIGWRHEKEGQVATVKDCYYIEGDRGIGQTGIGKETEIEDTTKKIDVVKLKEIFEAMDAYVPDDLVNPINNGNPILQWQQTTTAKTRSKTKAKTKDGESEDEDSEELVLPVNKAYEITSEYGNRIHPLDNVEKMHYGIDIGISAGSQVLSIADGTVTFAGESGGYGYCIEIEHTINGEKVYSFYAHLSQIDVEVGETVAAGQIIALSGGVPGTEGAGRTTGAHLHFEIRTTSGDYTTAVDPRIYFEF